MMYHLHLSILPVRLGLQLCAPTFGWNYLFENMLAVWNIPQRMRRNLVYQVRPIYKRRVVIILMILV